MLNQITVTARLLKDPELRDFGTPKERLVLSVAWKEGCAAVVTSNTDIGNNLNKNSLVTIQGKLVIKTEKKEAFNCSFYATRVLIVADKISLGEEPSIKQPTTYSELVEKLCETMSREEIARRCEVTISTVDGWREGNIPKSLYARRQLTELTK
jgi:hypothetical protein